MVPSLLLAAALGAAAAEHPNAEVIRRFYAAVSRGDAAALSVLLDDAFSCVAGPGPRAGSVLGKPEAVADLAGAATRTGGTFRVEVRGLFASDERGVAVVVERAERRALGLRLEERGVHVFRFHGDRIVGLTGLPERPEAVARFWR